MTPSPQQQSLGGGQPKRGRRWRLRRALIRWLGGTPAEPAADNAPTTALLLPGRFVAPAENPPPPLAEGVPLPAPDPERLAQYARRYFEYGEELNLRGAPDLSAVFFRQAYALLSGSHQELPGAAAATQASATLGSPPPATAPAPATLPGPSLQERLHTLRQRLTPQTAAEISAELLPLRQQGVRDPDFHKLEGLVALLLNDRGQAEQRFREALALDPNHYASLVNFAGVLLADGRLQEATEALQRALEQVPAGSQESVPALTNLSLAHQQAGRAMEAALLVHQIHRIEPAHLRPERLLEAAGTLEQMGEDPLAIDLLQWLGEQHPTDEGLRLLATLLERRGSYQEAALVYRRLLRDSSGVTP